MSLKYPVLLVHGMGFRDYKKICYWGRIPRMLEEMGCRVFFGNQDSNADIETNGNHLEQRILQILEETGAEKINIIAHSKGGLDTRYAISKWNLGKKVASLTTISTPHHGSKTMDSLMKIPQILLRVGSFCADIWFRILGDKNPHTYRVLQSFTTFEAEKFNAEHPDSEAVFYQSYAFIMKKSSSDIFMFLTHAFVYMFDGENDGLLAPDSAKWGEFKGIYHGVGNRGISHCDEVDMRRKRFSKKQGDGIADILDLYREIVSDLMKRNF